MFRKREHPFSRGEEELDGVHEPFVPPVLFERDGRSQGIFGGDDAGGGGGRFSWFVKIGGGRLPAFVLKIRICRIVSANMVVRLGARGRGGRTYRSEIVLHSSSSSTRLIALSLGGSGERASVLGE